MSLRVAKGFALPLDVAGETIAVLGKRGSGKTNTATVLVEELVSAGVQTVILDPVGAWWGLRSNAAGNGPGLEIPRLGGQHGDVPLADTAGALIADVALDSRQSLLIDLSDFPTKAAVGRFVTDFAQRLYRKKRPDSVLHLVLEEADLFAPQKVKGSEHMQGAIEQIVRRGRSRGMGVTLITQRSAVLSKDVLTQADVLIVMRTTGPHDLRAIREWVDSRGDEHGAGVLESLPGLTTGEGWVWNPERELIHRVQFRARKTFDSSVTPKAGEVRAEPERSAPIDITSLGEQIAATAEKVKAEDPRELRRRISELERELQQRPAETVEVEKIVEVPTPVFNGEIEKLDEFATTLVAASASIAGAADDIIEALERVKGAPVATVPARPTPRAEPAPRAAREKPRRPDPPEHIGDFTPTGPHQKILNAIAWLNTIGIPGERRRVAFLAGYRMSGTFAGYLSEMSSGGLITYPGPGMVALTREGESYAQPPEVAPTSDDIQDLVLSKLTGPQQKILRALINLYPHSVDRGELAEKTGYSLSGTFAGYLSELSSLGVITYPSRGTAAADPVLFID